ncbi:MAG: metalloprotease TldD [Candidatus Porifericomitaceae bacterium WSBS_2022_MAG_OTU9]
MSKQQNKANIDGNDGLALQSANQRLLVPVGLDEGILQRTVSYMAQRRLDAAELFFEAGESESWQLEDGRVKGSRSTSQGVGVRAVCGDKIGFAYADEIHVDALQRAASVAREITSSGGGEGGVCAWRGSGAPALYPAGNPLLAIDCDDKVQQLQRLDAMARGMDPRVREVIVSIAANHKTIMVTDIDGQIAADVRPLVRLNVSVLVEQSGRREQGSAGGGGRYDYVQLFADGKPERWVREAVDAALLNLESEAAPAGTMTVVLGPGWPGILLHEAVGHGLEGDFNRRGSSAFSGRIGERVAAPGCTIVDDGSLPGRRGSLTVDDEGVPGQCTVLIENGILRSYMQDKHNARLSGMAPTGNGRRESYAHMPMPRMTNTYMLAGEHDPEEIIASTSKGLYASQFGGGQVDITSGQFVFSASAAYLIENGRITKPLKGATLIGNGPDVLTKVSMVGNDLQLDQGIGVCGKDGQQVPVGVGQPTLRIDGLTVGGTKLQ